MTQRSLFVESGADASGLVAADFKTGLTFYELR
jgi:hypothetical protein